MRIVVVKVVFITRSKYSMIFLSLFLSLQLFISKNNFITMFRLILFYFLLENIRTVSLRTI